jgi:hypothetical protein
MRNNHIYVVLPQVACTIKELHWLIKLCREDDASSIASRDAVSTKDISSINSTP